MFKRVFQKWNIILAGLAIRLCIAPFTGHPCDMPLWGTFGKAILVEHANPYATFPYPPPWILITGFTYGIYLLLPSEPFLNFILKLPIILGDILLGITLHAIVQDLSSSRKKANYATALFLLNPYVIWISSVWGMFDALPALCTLLALRSFLKGNEKVSALFLGLGIAFKYYPILLLPVFLILGWKRERKIDFILRYALYAGLPLIVTSTPFLILDWQSYLRQIFSAPLMTHKWWSIPASYLASIYLLEYISPDLFSQLTSNFWWSNALSYGIFSILYIFVMLRLYHEDEQSISKFLNNGIMAVLLVTLLSSKIVCEQYFQWIVPFMIIDFSVFTSENKSFFDILWPSFFAFFSINVPIYNFFPDVQKRTYNYMGFLAPLVDFYEMSVPDVFKRTALFLLGLTISVTFALYLKKILGNTLSKIEEQPNRVFS